MNTNMHKSIGIKSNHVSDILNLLTKQDFEIQDVELQRLLNQAYLELGNLNGLLKLLSNKDILLSPLLVIESVKSSNIESINSTILEQLQISAKGRKIYNSEQKQTENYRQAVLAGFDYLNTNGDFDLKLILLIQNILEPKLSGIRDQQKVVIANNSTGQILWTPPIGKQNILNHLNNWLEALNANDDNDNLIKVAILHSQFEAIHPFVDGNGRTGRILIILFLVFKGYISYPCIYLSQYILQTRTYYYLNLQESQTENKHIGIVKYLTKGICEKAKHSANLIVNLSKIKSETNTRLKKTLPKIYSEQLVDYLYETPFYSIGSMCIDLDLTRNTASKYLKLLLENHFIEIYEIKKTKLFYSPVLLELLG